MTQSKAPRIIRVTEWLKYDDQDFLLRTYYQIREDNGRMAYIKAKGGEIVGPHEIVERGLSRARHYAVFAEEPQEHTRPNYMRYGV